MTRIEGTRSRWILAVLGAALCVGPPAVTCAESPAAPPWKYRSELLRPFWLGDTVEGESVLFIRDASTGESRGTLLFPATRLLAVRNSAGDVTYEEGRDYRWKPESREIVLPAGSRIASRTPHELRRPAKSQKYALTHRDGDGEIFFGAVLEYHAMQTCVTYTHAPGQWKTATPEFAGKQLPRTISRLRARQPLRIVLLGDSISAGCNASGWAKGAPYQPPYDELFRQSLVARYGGPIEPVNLAVGGTATPWALTMVDKIVEARPDLVLLAFGMNDSAGRPASEYKANVAETMERIRADVPEVEFILIAPMLGNRDWIALKPELFPQYRDALASLTRGGVALADLTSVWTAFFEHKKDWDLTGNGVNHPNDFGHRVYAQVLSSLLIPTSEELLVGVPSATPETPTTFDSGPLTFTETRLLHGYTYAYGIAAHDLDGDGDLDLTSADAEPNSNLYLLANDGKSRFTHSFIQKRSTDDDDPIRMERHAIGDINRDGRPDVVIVDNLKWDVRWFENPGKEAITQPWKRHRVCAPKELPGSYDVALADLDADGDLDVAASSWRFGNRFDWFENVGSPGDGNQWTRHSVEEMVGETRTIEIADFNRDGKPDLLGTSRTGPLVVWYENSGKPATDPWKKHVIDTKTLFPAHGHAVDMDRDGDLDVVAAAGIAGGVGFDSPDSHQIAWFENVGKPGPGTEWKKHLINSHFAHGFEAVAGDLDGDGDVDVVGTGWSPDGRLAWFENTGDPRGEWKMHMLKPKWSNAVTVIVVDLDKDGRLDIVACAERGANEVRWWRNDGPAKK